MTERKSDPTLSRRWSFSHSHLQTLASGGARGARAGKATAGGSWAGVSVSKAAMARGTASANTDRAKGHHIHISIFIY